MNIASTVLFSVILALASCQHQSNISNSVEEIGNATPESTRPIPQTVNRISDENADTVYLVVLEALRYNHAFPTPELDHLGAMEWTLYRNKTIKPESLTAIQDSLSEYPNLVASLVSSNESPRILEEEYPVLYPMQRISSSASTEEMYSAARRKYPKSKAAVSFSNIGIDSENKTALIYVEYFSPNKGLLKFYLLMELERYAPIKDRIVFSGVNVKKVFSVM